jgi:hypothetical protein
MIQLEVKAFSSVRQKAIDDWLRLPACGHFLDLLAQEAAVLTAVAGNFLVNNDQDAQGDANLAAEGARKFLEAINIIKTIKGDVIHDGKAYEFHIVDLKPDPVVKVVSPNANQLH